MIARLNPGLRTRQEIAADLRRHAFLADDDTSQLMHEASRALQMLPILEDETIFVRIGPGDSEVVPTTLRDMGGDAARPLRYALWKLCALLGWVMFIWLAVWRTV